VERWRWLAAGFALACAAFVVATTTLLVWNNWTPLPYWDHWEELVQVPDWSWSWLPSQHNEHRILIPRLVFLSDALVFAGRPVLSTSLILVSLAVLATTLAHVAAGELAPDRPLVAWAWGLSYTLIFFAVQWENLIWAFQVQFVGVLAETALALAAVALGPPSLGGAAVVVLLSGMAAFTLASGISVPVMALVLAAWTGKPSRYLALCAVGAVVWPALYMWGYTKPPQTADPFESARHLPQVARFVLEELGGPIQVLTGEKRSLVCLVAGACILGLFGLSAWGHRSAASKAGKTLVVFSMTVLIGVGLTALGRVGMGADAPLASRYTSPVLSFWVATVLLLVLSRPPQKRWQIVLLTLPLVAWPVIRQQHEIRVGTVTAQQRLLALPALLADEDDATLLNVYFETSRPLLESGRLRQSQSAYFAAPVARLMGRPLSEGTRILRQDQCGDARLTLVAVDKTSDGLEMLGSSDAQRPSGGPDLVVTDRSGLVVGYGVSGLNPEVVLPGGRRPQVPASLVVRIKGPQDLDGVQVFLLRDRGRAACPAILQSP
jgi:hypothetical protein